MVICEHSSGDVFREPREKYVLLLLVFIVVVPAIAFHLGFERRTAGENIFSIHDNCIGDREKCIIIRSHYAFTTR